MKKLIQGWQIYFRCRSSDSSRRELGFVKHHRIRGVPAFVYFSWDMKIPAWNIFGRLASIRFSRIGEILE